MVAFLVSAISYGIILLYGCLGEILTEKAGNLNLGIPGIMCMGTVGGCVGVSLYMGFYMSSNTDPYAANWFLLMLSAISFSILFSVLTGLIYCFLTVSFRCNQNVVGLALTIFGSGASQFIMDNFVKTTYFAAASSIFKKFLPALQNPNWFYSIFLSHGFLAYLGIALAIICGIVLKRTRIGLNLRAVGENPATADAMGVNVTKYKYAAISCGSAISGLGGLFYIMNYIGGSWSNSSTIEAMGWLSIALVVFAIWKPCLAILGSFVFGAFSTAVNFINGISFSQMQLLRLLPYVVTVVVLVITSIFGKKNVQPPESLGVNYFREER